jgi:hypothetical protein
MLNRSMILAFVLAGALGCGAREDRTTLHEARTQNTPTSQAAQADPSVDYDDPYNRTLPEETVEEIEEIDEAAERDLDDVAPTVPPPRPPQGPMQPGSPDVGTPVDPSGSNPGDIPGDDVDDDDALQDPTSPDLP